MSAKTTTNSRQALPVLPCTCANLRRAARAVTRMYNQELRPEGIEITQFTLLMVLDKAGEAPQGRLGEILAMDSTTLTRMLELSRKRGWVQSKEGDDRRERIFRLTKAGLEKFHRASRRWRQAQERLGAALGDKTMEQLGALLVQATGATLDS